MCVYLDHMQDGSIVRNVLNRKSIIIFVYLVLLGASKKVFCTEQVAWR